MQCITKGSCKYSFLMFAIFHWELTIVCIAVLSPKIKWWKLQGFFIAWNFGWMWLVCQACWSRLPACLPACLLPHSSCRPPASHHCRTVILCWKKYFVVRCFKWRQYVARMFGEHPACFTHKYLIIWGFLPLQPKSNLLFFWFSYALYFLKTSWVNNVSYFDSLFYSLTEIS